MQFLLKLFHRTPESFEPQHPLLIIVIALALAVITQYLLYNVFLGVNAAIVTILVVVTALILFLKTGTKVSFETFLSMLAAILFSMFLAIRASGFLSLINVLAVLYLLGYALDVCAGTRVRATILEYVAPFILLPFAFLRRSGEMIQRLGAIKNGEVHHARAKQIVAGIGMALPVVVIFALLFASADQVFARYLDRYLGLFFSFSFSIHLVARVLLILVLTVLFSGAAGYAISRMPISFGKAETKGRMSSVALGFFLGTVNVLFALFLLVQFSYFFGGKEKLVALGITYAEYARKGFFGLLAIAGITFLLVWISERMIERNGGHHPLSFRVLSSLLTLQTLVVIASSFQRLRLYEDAFGFTNVRLFAYVFLIWLALMFLLFIAKLFFNKSDQFFLKAAFVSVIMFLVGINIVGPDRFIAQKNIDRFESGKDLDVWYLDSLSHDAVPALVRLFENPRLTDQVIRGELGRGLMYRLMSRLSQPEVSDWRALHLARLRARRLLRDRRAQLLLYQDYIPPEVSKVP